MDLDLFLKALRYQFIYTTSSAALLGIAAAWATLGQFNLLYAILTVIGLATIHLGTNTANDYFDWKSGNDNIQDKPSPFSGGSQLIQKGLVKPSTVKTLMYVFFTISALIGIYLVMQTGLTLLGIGVIGIFIGYFYTAEPIKIGYRGLGEIAAMTAVTLIVIGAFYVQTQTITITAVLTGLIVGLIKADLLLIAEFSDYKSDRRARKNNWPVIFGLEKATTVSKVLVSLAYLTLLLGIALRYMPITTALGFLTLPAAWSASQILSNGGYRRMAQIIKAQGIIIPTMIKTSLLLTTGYVISVFI